mgnify:CR=1 FL=1
MIIYYYLLCNKYISCTYFREYEYNQELVTNWKYSQSKVCPMCEKFFLLIIVCIFSFLSDTVYYNKLFAIRRFYENDMFVQFKYMLTNYCFQKINIPDKKQRHVKTYTYIYVKYHDRPSVNITSFADRLSCW